MRETIKKIIYAIFLGATSRLARFTISPFIAPYLYGHGFSESLISFMSSFGPLTLVFIIPVVGLIADKIGRKKILIFGAFLQVLAITLFLLIRQFSVVSLAVSALLLSNISSYIFGLSVLTLIQGWIDKKRGLFTGIHQSISSIGAFVGPLIGAYIVFFYSTYEAFLAALIITVFLLVAAFFVKERDSYKIEKISLKEFSFFKAVSVFFKNKSLRAMGFLGFSVHLSEPVTAVFIPLFAVNTLGIEISKVGIITAALFSLNVTQFISGRFADRFGSGKVVVFGTTLSALALGSLFFVNSFGQLLVAALFISLGLSSWNTSAWSYMYEIAHKDKSGGQISGSYASCASFGQFVSYTLSGFLLLFLDIRNLFMIYAVILLIVICFTAKTIINSSLVQKHLTPLDLASRSFKK